MKRLPLLTVLALIVLAVAVTAGGALLAPTTGSGSPPPSASGIAAATPTPAGTASPASATPTPAPTATAVPLADVPIVPVTHFRTTLERTGFEDVRATVAGTSRLFDSLGLIESDADAILAALGVEVAAGDRRLYLAADADELAAQLASNRKRLGFMRASEVGPGVRALGWGDRTIFGVGSAETVEAWGLTAELPEAGDPFDPAGSWTLVAGGDILLDRGVAQTVKVNRKGVDFPFDGGTAEITSRYCCSSFGWQLPRVERTGDDGAMRALLSGADLAIANFENPAPDSFRYHTSGTVFSADPALIEGLANAGIDWVSLANNHIGDAGRNGILQTIDNLAEHGIAAGGAGRNARAARRPSLIDVGGTTLGILAYDAIAPGYRAGAEQPGSATLSAQIVEEDIVKAQDAGAEVIIVFPHWGTEYDPTPFAGQREIAQTAIDAGADLVIGNHAHWAGALEVHDGSPIWYALGNFVFDQTWSEPTMEGIMLELTFRGPQLVQARMRPHIILDKAQPNFLDPAGDGAVVMGQIWDASEGLLDW